MRGWDTVRDFFRSKHIQLALVSGASIVALAYVSKRVLPEPMDNLFVSLPALLVVLAEATLGIKKDKWYARTGYWLVAIALATIAIIVLHLAR